MRNTYWDSNGKFQNFADCLQTMIPQEGAVENARQNPALEKFRRASNVYYDLYNNGLCNRAGGFRFAFGFPAGDYAYKAGAYGKRYSAKLYEMVESAMDDIVLHAMLEQAPKFRGDS